MVQMKPAWEQVFFWFLLEYLFKALYASAGYQGAPVKTVVKKKDDGNSGNNAIAPK